MKLSDRERAYRRFMVFILLGKAVVILVALFASNISMLIGILFMQLLELAAIGARLERDGQL